MVQIGDFGSIPKLNCRTQKQDSVFVLKPGILAQLKNVVRVTAVRLDAWLGSYRLFRTLRSLLEYYTLLDTSFLLIQT